MATERVDARIEAAPSEVFGLLIDVKRLPEWNRAITEVVETPAELVAGAVWKVRLKAMGQSWVSRSTLSELDATAGRFSYRSQTDDGNPSYADWEWIVRPDVARSDGTCSTVTVAVDLHPTTFWRKHLLVRIRRPALRKEMRASLAALGAATQG